jgi:DNA-binding NarL/FixJ family response regulator
MKIRLAVVEDQTVVRQGLVALLTNNNLFHVVGEFENGETFVNYYSNQTINLPDIVLLDYYMPKLDGLGVCKWLKQNKPTVKPVILSLYNDKSIIQDFIIHGARAFLSKDTPIDKIIATLTAVYSNNFCFNEFVSTELFATLTKRNTNYSKPKKGLILTSREKEIAVLISKEFSYKEIANKLGISLRTVETHKTNILEKIGATKVTGLVVYVSKKGWI